MEVMGGTRRGGGFYAFEALRKNVDDALHILNLSLNQQPLFGEDGEAEGVEDIGHDDHVEDTGFVFEADKEDAFGGAGSLADNDAARHPDQATIAD